ncbi:MAG: YIP1 family protein [Candidatus Methanofastidiosia archaeon]|jgi:hypothetical protein
MLQILNPFKAGKEIQKLKSERKWLLALAIVFAAGILSVAGRGLLLQKELVLRNQYIQEEMGAPVTLEAGIYIMIFFILIPINWGLKSLIFHVFSRILGGEEEEISSTTHLLAYTYIPLIFKGFVDVFRGLTYQPPPYQEYVYQMQNPNIPLLFLKEYNIFFLWTFILMVIVLKVQYNISKLKAILVVFIPYLIYWIIVLRGTFGLQF